MQYKKVTSATFINRPNRFIAQVEIGGEVCTVHVKNTGRCKEILIPGSRVFLAKCDNPMRKTEYDLIAVEKAGLGLVNIDSQAPNQVVLEWLNTQDLDLIKPEHTFGDSRLDFYLEKGDTRILMEVKGCTLEVEGVGYFPDAPTARGAKHLRELTAAASQGYMCYVVFVVQMAGIAVVRPNSETDPAFARAWRDAEDAGVRFLCLPTVVTSDSINAEKNKELAL